jgi:hypothetical protein
VTDRFFREIRRAELTAVFENVSLRLEQLGKRCEVVLLGGCAILALNIRDRATRDIDIFPSPEAKLFKTLCGKESVEVDIVTLCSTVDPAESPKQTVFAGDALTVNALHPIELLKTKIERYYKQDPEDIDAILNATEFSVKAFEKLAKEMMIDFVGDPERLRTTLEIIADKHYGAEAVRIIQN